MQLNKLLNSDAPKWVKDAAYDAIFSDPQTVIDGVLLLVDALKIDIQKRYAK